MRVEVTESKDQDVGDMRLVTLEAHVADGAGQSVQRTTVVKRPDAVGIVAYDDRRDVVVLVEQFRAGPYAAAGMQTMLEIAAGYADPGESTKEAARRELQEETGLVADRLIHIATYFPAPTLSTEQMSLWCGLIDSSTALERAATGAERIRVVRLSGEEVVALVGENQVSNALTLTALQWLVQVRALLLGTRRREDVL
jgi:ADP-ribose pyrophosphatase